MNDTQAGSTQQLEQQVATAVEQVASALRARGWTLCAAESCTGGWLSKSCTDLAGSSDWFHGAYISYSYTAKEQQLGVIHDDLLEHGAVSEAIAQQMALGARRASGADVAVAMTGIAGPGGGLPNKPVGMVCYGWSVRGGSIFSATELLKGNRAEVRLATVLGGLRGVLKAVEA
jgi:nicotinamide-nucleotide amidase